MSEYITLLGAEEVERAARSISESASTMTSAAEYTNQTVQQQERILDSFLDRFEALIVRLEEASKL